MPKLINKYIEFSTAKKGGTAPKNANNAYLLYRWFVRFSSSDPKGFIKMPDDINTITGGNLSSVGGLPYLLPFDQNIGMTNK